MLIDLRTRYLGLELRNPLIVAACPLTSETHLLERLELAGAGAAVLTSLFEEQVSAQPGHGREDGSSNSARTPYIPHLDDYNAGVDTYLLRITAAKQAVSMPIFGSLNGAQHGGWVRFARLIQDAGADGLELNIYFVPTEPERTGGEVEDRYLELVSAVREMISIPLTVKIGPYFSSLPNFARRLVAAGANGLILFNRYLQPDINLETLELRPELSLSSNEEMRLPLRWIAILRGQLSASLAATSGIHAASDVVKLLLAGADATMMASALIRHGPEHLASVLRGVTDWMRERGYRSVSQLQGTVSRRDGAIPAALERANYTQALTSYVRKEKP